MADTGRSCPHLSCRLAKKVRQLGLASHLFVKVLFQGVTFSLPFSCISQLCEHPLTKQRQFYCITGKSLLPYVDLS